MELWILIILWIALQLNFLLRHTVKNNFILSPKEKIDALSYRLEIRDKQTQLEWFKVVASYLLSNIGLFALTVLYAIIGKLLVVLHSDTDCEKKCH